MKTGQVLRAMIGIILLISVVDGDVDGSLITNLVGDNQCIVASYTKHAPIVITGNAGFLGWPGSGTEEDPYLIEGRNITHSSVCIDIMSTTVYFEIRNCRLSSDGASSSAAVHFQDVAHGSIINCIIDSHYDGIVLELCTDCTLVNNAVTANSRHGFYLWASASCTSTNNIAAGNSRHGFYLDYSTSCKLINNTAARNVDGFEVNSCSGTCMLANNAAISNLADGFYIHDSDSCNLTNNVAIDNDEGFVLWSSSTHTLTNNTATNNSHSGFYFYGFSSSTLTSNAATGNRHGFYFYLSSGCTLVNNTFVNDGLVIRGTSLSQWLHDMSGNSVNGRPLGYFRDLVGASIDASPYGQVILANCFDVTVQHAVVNNVTQGFQIGYSTDCRLSNNSATGNEYGFYLWDSANCVLTNNIASGNSYYGFYLDGALSSILTNNTASSNLGDGFYLEDSDSCNLTSNMATRNSGDGFYLHWSENCILMNNLADSNEEGFELSVSDGCRLTSNTATSNIHGFMVAESDDSTLTGNIATSNSDDGFYLSSTFDICTVTNNTATSNSDDGFYLYGFPSSVLTNNTATNNSDDGFYIQSSFSYALVNNTAANNVDAGIYLHGSRSGTLLNNSFVDNGLVISGSDLSQWLHDMSGNSVNGRPLGYFRDLAGASIDASPYGQVILANCLDVIVQYVVVNHATVGFQLGYSTNCTLRNNTATGNSDTGFSLSYSDSCILANNSARNNLRNGFYLYSSYMCTLTNNTATGNHAGFYVQSSSTCTLANNTFVNNGLVISGSDLSQWLHDVSENWVNGKPLGYFRDLVGASIDATPYGQVILANCPESLIQHAVVNNATVGFLVGYSIDCRLMNNTATGNEYGFYIWDSDSCVLTENNGTNNSNYGFRLYSSSTCILTNNTAANNSGDGFYLYDSDSCDLTNNTAANNSGDGFYLYDSDSCDLTNNTAANNSGDGFYLYDSDSCDLTNNIAVSNPSDGFYLHFSDSCILTDDAAISNSDYGFYLFASYGCTMMKNTATGNEYGFCLWDSDNCILANNTAASNLECGICIGVSINCTLMENMVTSNSDTGIHIEGDSSENHIYYNVIRNNTSNAWDDGSLNIWDDGVSLGNYWGDFDRGDVYTVPGSAGSVDRYPFCVEAYLSVALNHPDDIEYESGTTGHGIIWHPSDPYPNSYEILRNGTQVDTGSWNGTDTGIDVDGLSLGTFNYTLIVYDMSENSASDTVFVTVVDTTPPIINHPGDIQYEEETMSHFITWNANDLNPESYEVYKNGSIAASDIWNGSGIILDVHGLSIGIHNYTIVVSDTSGNAASDTVFVTVTSTSTTPTATTTTTETTSEPEGILLMRFIAAASIGAVVIVTIVYIKRRK